MILSKAYTAMALCMSYDRNSASELFSTIQEGDLQHAMAILSDKPKLINATISCSHTRFSLLHYAATHGQSEMLSFLLEKGASLNATNAHGQTALMLACKNGRVSCIETLVEWGADILMFDVPDGRTCLHYASKSGHLECVKRIIESAQLPRVAQTWGYARFVNVRDRNGATPLHLAARFNHPSVVHILLNKGALVCATTTRSGGRGCSFGSTPLHFAARGGSAECVKELLAWGADRMHRNSQGHTAFAVATRYRKQGCASLLNPLSAEPLVWPSPWKFMSDLDPEARTLLEAALAQANDAWERRLISSYSELPASKQEIDGGNSKDDDDDDDEKSDLCCICFERACMIEARDCGHQMCARCALALCCHNKPSPGMVNSPAPPCPFCRQKIMQLKPARWQDGSQKPEQGGDDDDDDDDDDDARDRGCEKQGSEDIGAARGPGFVLDVDAIKACSLQQEA